jgi:putative restriction endonuclease
MTTNRWTKDQLKLAFHLYCQLPFGKMHRSNPEIVELAGLIGRTPSAVAMKLVNFASLDPAITSTGRSGLDNASALDREIWNEFHADWEGLALECSALRSKLLSSAGRPRLPELDADEIVGLDDFTGETRLVATEQRIKQHFFRRAVLSIYRGRCCMSGVSDTRLLQASHIVPWSMDKANRLNPSNGLCLSVLHDRAFDRGMIGLTAELTIVVSERLRSSADDFVQRTLGPLHGRTIELPERFLPSKEFLARHMNEVFDNS